MGDWLLSLLDWKVHGPLGAAVVAILYAGRQHMKRDARSFEHLETRLKVLETDRVVQADVKRLEDQMGAGFTEVRASTNKILEILATKT